ncbi:MAG TPA: hypothetical protein VGM33_21350 [Baekduia sp.]|jgi:hypothetical protein
MIGNVVGGRKAVVGTVTAAVLAAGSFGGVAGAASDTHHYPAKYEKSFESTCAKTAKAVGGKKITKSQAKAYCKSALKCIEKKLTLKQFEQAAAKMQSGETNPHAKVLAACEKQAAAKLK